MDRVIDRVKDRSYNRGVRRYFFLSSRGKERPVQLRTNLGATSNKTRKAFMKRSLSLFVVLLLAGASHQAAQAQAAAQAPVVAATAQPASAPLKIGVINVPGAIVSTDEGKRDIQAIDAKFEPKRKEFMATNAAIEELQKKLKAEGEKLSKEDRAARTRELEAKQKQFKRDVEAAQKEFATEKNEAFGRIAKPLLALLDKYANDNAYTIIFNITNDGTSIPAVQWRSQAIDLTKAIADAYNAEHPVKAAK